MKIILQGPDEQSAMVSHSACKVIRFIFPWATVQCAKHFLPSIICFLVLAGVAD